MDVKQYIELIKNNEFNNDAISSIEELYGVSLTDELKRIVSVELEDYFISEKCRVISVKEILRTEEFVGVDFTELGMIPLIDCKDDDYIVFNFETQKYEMYNIYDEVSFRDADVIEELILGLDETSNS